MRRFFTVSPCRIRGIACRGSGSPVARHGPGGQGLGRASKPPARASMRPCRAGNHCRFRHAATEIGYVEASSGSAWGSGSLATAPSHAQRRGPPSRQGGPDGCLLGGRPHPSVHAAKVVRVLIAVPPSPRPSYSRLARVDGVGGSPDWRQTRDRRLCPTTGRQEPNPGTTPNSAPHTPDRCSGTSAAS